MSLHQRGRYANGYLARITPDNGGAKVLHDLFAWIEGHEARC